MTSKNYRTDQSATHCEYITVAMTTANDNDLEELLYRPISNSLRVYHRGDDD